MASDGRVTFGADPQDVEEGRPAGRNRPLSHRGSIGSLSVHSLALPVAYRTVSIQLDEEAQEKTLKLQTNADEITKELRDIQWHIKPAAEICQQLKSHPDNGLSTAQVAASLAQFGANTHRPPPSRIVHKTLVYCFGGFGSLLLAGGILCLIAWKPLGNPPAPANAALGVVLILVFIIQALFNAWQDYSSSKVMASITTMLPDFCVVTRNGSQTSICGADLVPGDLVHIKLGDKIPADLRLLSVSLDLKFDRSVLTGESKPFHATIGSAHDNYLETHNIALQGTHCVCGSGIGIVVDTGETTVFGKIAKLSSQPRRGLTTLQKEVLRFVLVIISLVIFIVLLVIILWAAWLRKDHPGWIDVPLLIVDCVSVAVAFIPEGLPIALATCLTITARAMKRNDVLCKSLATVETLGSVSLICSDKTGTLTKNEMCVTNFSVFDQTFAVPYKHEKPTKAISDLGTVAGLCNAGKFVGDSGDVPLELRKISGDATDQAVLRFGEALRPRSELVYDWRKVYELGFNSKNKFMLTLTEPISEKSDTLTLMMKGAPEILLARCAFIQRPDATVTPLTDHHRQTLEQIQLKWAVEGKRVLLLTQKHLARTQIKSTPEMSSYSDEVLEAGRGLTVLGMVAIVDPPREETPYVINTLRGAGIRVFMVTGDFRHTAAAIARQCNILLTPPALVHDFTALKRADFKTPEVAVAKWYGKKKHVAKKFSGAIVLEGQDLIRLNEAQWDQLALYEEAVFSRTTPEQKLRIVKEFQAREQIVGMTGDGVNDAPSLKQADVGISLSSGSAVAIEASDMVLLSSFSGILAAVSSGRCVFDNLRKTICYLLPAGSFSELWPILLNVFFGLPQVLSSFLMIVICCFTDCAGAMTLAYEAPEANILERGPRNVHTQHLVDGKLILQAYGFVGVMMCACSMAMGFWHFERRGIAFNELWFAFGDVKGHEAEEVELVSRSASSVYFVTLVVMQFFNLLTVRTRYLSIFQAPPIGKKETRNLWIIPAVLFALAVAFIFNYIPGLQRLILSTEVPVEYWFLPVTFGLGLMALDEGRKFCLRKWPKGLMARIAW